MKLFTPYDPKDTAKCLLESYKEAKINGLPSYIRLSKGGEEKILIDQNNSYAKYFELKSFNKNKQRELFGSSLEKILKFCSILTSIKYFK